jgi:glucosylceramidase
MYCTPLAGHCDAPILADTKKQTLEIRNSFYFMGHFSRFVPRGSSVLATVGATDTNTTFMATAVLTPAGAVVVVAVNTDDGSAVKYQLDVDGEFAQFVIPPHSIQTLTIAPTIE